MVRTAIKAVLALVLVTGMASPVAAQEAAGVSTKFSVGSGDLFAPAAQGAETTISIRGQFGGLFWGGAEGFVLGAGIGVRPFNNRQVEVIGDVSFARSEGSNGIYVAANGLYHFNTNDENFSPYAGAGIGVLHLFDDTQARFEIVGGLELNRTGRYPIRPEVRFFFASGDVATILQVVVQLGQTSR